MNINLVFHSIILIMTFGPSISIAEDEKNFHFPSCKKASTKNYSCFNSTSDRVQFFDEIRINLKIEFTQRKKDISSLINCLDNSLNKKLEISNLCKNKIEFLQWDIDDHYKPLRLALALWKPEKKTSYITEISRPKTKFTVNISHIFPGTSELQPLNKKEVKTLQSLEKEMIKKWKDEFYNFSSTALYARQQKAKHINKIKNKNYSKSKENKKIAAINKLWETELKFSFRNSLQASYQHFFIENLSKYKQQYKGHLASFPLAAYLESADPDREE
ncbi:hypothetical protein HON22_00110, partial [Candidatus Peregrinibacteria bacterium]|nr:hypothetical protein [Candidatus Peregrinibacteria bacterium]